jgi:hypothetical protein
MSSKRAMSVIEMDLDGFDTEADFDAEADFDLEADFDTAFDIETTKMAFIYVPPSGIEGEPALDQDTVDPRESIPWPASPLLEEPAVELAYEWPQGSEWPLDAEWPQESELPQDLQLPQDLDFESVKLSQESWPTQEESESRPTQEPTTLPQARRTRKCHDCDTYYTTRLHCARCEACRRKRRPTVLRLRSLVIDNKYEKTRQ